MSQQLEDYIRQARQSGLNDEQIRQQLLISGWKEPDIAAGFSAVSSSNPSSNSKLIKVIAIVIIVALFAGGAYFAAAKFGLIKKSSNTLPSAQTKTKEDANIQNKELPDVAVEFSNVPSPMAIGKEYGVSWRTGKSIAAVEILISSPDSNGHQIYKATSTGVGTFQWKVSYNQYQTLEGWYELEIIGKTADYDTTAQKLDQIDRKLMGQVSRGEHPTQADMDEYAMLQKKLESMKVSNKGNGFAILEKELPEIPGNSLSNISSIDSFEIRYELQTLPLSVAVGTNLKFVYRKHSAMVRSCVINKDNQKDIFWCYIPWSSRLSEYASKENWAIFVGNSTQGTGAERDQKRMKDMQQLAVAIQNYKNKNGIYPCSNGRCGDQSSIYGQSNVVFPNFQGVHYEDPLGEKDKNFEYIYSSDANGFRVYAGLENSFQDNDADFYCVDNIGTKEIISEQPLQSSCKFNPAVTNYGYRCDYFTDKNSAYHKSWQTFKPVKLPNSDPYTFRVNQNENSCIALDKNQIYLLDEVILPGADPATFEVFTNGNYAKDENHVYRIYPTPGIIEGADPKVFEPPQGVGL